MAVTSSGADECKTYFAIPESLPNFRKLPGRVTAQRAAGPVLDVPGQAVVVAEDRRAHLQYRFGSLGPVPELLRSLHPVIHFFDQRLHPARRHRQALLSILPLLHARLIV